jgi:hypothetical protein
MKHMIEKLSIIHLIINPFLNKSQVISINILMKEFCQLSFADRVNK